MPNPITYRLAPGLEIVNLSDGQYQLRSDFTAVRLSGETAAAFAERLLPALDSPRTFDELSALLPGYRPESLRAQLDAFVEEGVLVRGGGHPPASNEPFRALLDEMGVGAESALATLAARKVAILGLEAHGAHAAAILADAGIGQLVLVDPYPFEAAHYTLTPVRDRDAGSLSREAAIARLVARDQLSVTRAEEPELTRERVHALAHGCHLLLVCWDRGFGAAQHWANEAALGHGIPALFSELRATSALAGPFYMPERSACWMCYRMRALAAEQDFELAMAYEEHLDRQRLPSLARRPLLPSLPALLGATLALEAVKFLLRLNQPTLVDKVQVFDGLSGESRTHPVLVKPYCPTCSKKKDRHSPTASDLIDASRRPRPRLPSQAAALVSEHCGIVVHLSSVAKDATEPHAPQVWRARLSNHCFLSEVKDAHLACSGKGMTREAAWASCLGEAVERYSGGCWDPSELVLARRRELDGQSLDPNDLVLYRANQYDRIPYAPYREDAALRWVSGRSLITGQTVWVPAIAVFMEYQVHGPEEYIAPVTSNGLAAGATLADAVLSAIYEVAERDAVLVSWMNRLRGRRLDASTHPDPDVRHLATAYARRGVDLAMFEMPTDHPIKVVMAIAFQRGGYGGPFATVGMGADVDLTVAARRAAMEVGQVRPAFRERCRTTDAARIAELVAAPSRVARMEDHALLYADPALADAFEFLNGPLLAWPEANPVDTAQALTEVLRYFAWRGQEVLYVNLTPRDLEPLGLFTARALLPGFQPIWFGDEERRLGGTRVLDAPIRLGIGPDPTTYEALNPLPHPIA